MVEAIQFQFNSFFWLASVIFAVMILGLFQTLRDHKKFILRREFLLEYCKHLNHFLETGASDEPTYAWLVHRSQRMQSYLGALGIIGFGNAIRYQPQYQVIVQGVSDIHRTLNDAYDDAEPYVRTVTETLTQYEGWLDDTIGDHAKFFKNPIQWVRRGFQDVVVIPLSILEITGLVSIETVGKWGGSRPYKFLMSVVGLLAAFKTLAPEIFNSFIALVTNLVGGQ